MKILLVICLIAIITVSLFIFDIQKSGYDE